MARATRPLWRDPRALVVAVLIVWLSASWWRSASDGLTTTADPGLLAAGTELAALTASHTHVSFDTLVAAEYRAAASAQQSVQLSKDAARLHGRLVSIDGFMLPTESSGTVVTAFILNASRDLCMFGAPTRADQRVEVTMVPDRRAPLTHQPLRVFGTLEIRPTYEGRELTGLYRLSATALGPPGVGQ
jgi:hypothetical protein